MKKSTGKQYILIGCCLILLLSSIFYFVTNKTESASKQSVTFTDLGFDTVITFSATCSQKDFDKYVTVLKEKFTYYNQLFDQYNEYDGVHNVYTLNNNAYKNKIEVDDSLIDCIKLAFEINDLDSSFDCTQGDLLSVWHNYRTVGMKLNNEGKDGNLPTEDELTEALSHAGKDKVVFEKNTIQFLDKELKIDLGGIAKGYATQKVKEELQNMGLSNGFINAGGNVVIIGPKEDGSDWSIGIQSPDSSSSLLACHINTEKCLVTSGDYQRYYTVDGKRYCHIINPSSGYPASYIRSVTVITNDSGYADALSTTLFCLSIEDGFKLVEKLQKTMDIDVIWVLDQGTSQLTPNYTIDSYDIYVTEEILQQIETN